MHITLIPDFTISRAGLSDAQSILALQKLAFRSEAELHNNFEIPPMVQSIDSISKDFSIYQFYKMEVKGAIVGAIKVKLLENQFLWIGRLVVHPAFQRRGLGKSLMQYVEQHFNSAAGFELFTAQKSIRNIRFYEDLGYVIAGTFTEPGHSEIVLVRMFRKNSGNSLPG